MISLSKRTSMALFSDPTDHYCHRVRIVLAEKGISSEMIESSKDNIDPEILELIPGIKFPFALITSCSLDKMLFLACSIEILFSKA